jgi:alpha-tubulin suppressor-like RCC1 family protein
VATLTNLVDLEAGQTSTCARKADSTYWCWGGSTYGLLGDANTTTQTFNPVPAPQLAGMSSFTVGENHLCGLVSSTEVKCIGFNNYGQLGNGGTAMSTTAASVIW